MAAGRKVVIVEDDASMVSVLRTLLEIEGYSVVVAPGGQPPEEISQDVLDAEADVLLMDVHLKHASGLDVLRLLRESGGPLPRVVMSSGMDVSDQCYAAGADGFLMKPYMPDELLAILQG